jgi:hypothetical protein
MFESLKVRPEPAREDTPLLGRLLALLARIEQGWIGFPVANVLAYLAMSSVTE